MKTLPTVAAAALWLALWSCSPSSSLAAPTPRAAAAAGPSQHHQQGFPEARASDVIDPALDALADEHAAAAKDDDRTKRQLSFVQNKLLNFLKPLPVVDVTKEEEKYGNDGDKFNRIGRGVIGGVEKVSSMLSSALSFPVDTAKKLSRSATEILNNLGGRLIGLQ